MTQKEVRNRAIIILIILFVVALGLCMLIDATVVKADDYIPRFNYAYLELPGGNTIEGNLDSWKEFKGELILVIDGKTYFTHRSRCTLTVK